MNLDKIRGTLSHVERLREASLDNEQVAYADQPGAIGKTCPGELFIIVDHVLTLRCNVDSFDMIVCMPAQSVARGS